MLNACLVAPNGVSLHHSAFSHIIMAPWHPRYSQQRSYIEHYAMVAFIRYDSIDIRSQVLVGSNQSTTKFHNEALICCNAEKESSQTNDKRQRGQPRHPVHQGVGTFHLGAPSRPPIEAVGRWSATASFDGVTHRCAKIDREAVNKKLLAACEKRK